jgi:aminoglycoside phosphotransferase (APT) family kinase protein
VPTEIAVVKQIAEKNEITGDVRLMPSSGMVNEAWMLDDRFVLRITTAEDAFDEAGREAWIVPIVRAAGAMSPEIIAADLSQNLIDRPYTIYRKAEGVLLGEVDDDPELFARAYKEVGREFARLHTIEVEVADRHRLRETSSFDAAKQLGKAKEAGKIGEEDARLVGELIIELSSRIGDRSQRALVHNDVHPWNMFVDPESRKLTAIIDWGDTSWGDPAGEFASMPFIAVPYMLEGYREAGGDFTDNLVAKSLHLGLALCLWEVRDLDPARFKRQWWRHSPKGFGEDVRLVRELLG